ENLKVACKALEDAGATGDITEIARSDVAFHDIIIGATGNDRMVMMINNLAEQMYRYRFEYIKDTSRHERLIMEHRALMDAIIGENIIGARDAAREHIDNQEKAILLQIHLDSEK
nr:FCD domain-containing protein [Lachnospiraceae bacterium]